MSTRDTRGLDQSLHHPQSRQKRARTAPGGRVRRYAAKARRNGSDTIDELMKRIAGFVIPGKEERRVAKVAEALKNAIGKAFHEAKQTTIRADEREAHRAVPETGLTPSEIKKTV